MYSKPFSNDLWCENREYGEWAIVMDSFLGRSSWPFPSTLHNPGEFDSSATPSLWKFCWSRKSYANFSSLLHQQLYLFSSTANFDPESLLLLKHLLRMLLFFLEILNTLLANSMVIPIHELVLIHFFLSIHILMSEPIQHFCRFLPISARSLRKSCSLGLVARTVRTPPQKHLCSPFPCPSKGQGLHFLTPLS